MRVALTIPCYVDQLMPRAGIAVVEVLERLGCTVVYPSRQTCCGQPPLRAGHADHARDVSRHMLDVFEHEEHVVTPSGSCAAMVKVFYPQLFEGTPDAVRADRLAHATWEFSDFL